MDLYAENILDHFRHPRGKQTLKNPTALHHEVNASCGDEVTLQLVIENDRIMSLGWQGTGCAVSQAAMSMLGEELVGKSLDEAGSLDADHIREILGVPIGPRRFKCAFLGLHALKNTLRTHEGKEPQGWLETIGSDA